MEAVVQLYGGGSVVLAPLLEWETTLTGGVPCDSFYLKCPYHAAQAALLERAWRVTLQEKGTVLLRAVVDETEIVQNGAGQTLGISGRGLAALLLDNEAEAVTYTRPTLSELLRRHAAPYGLSWGMFSELQGQAEYSVSSGESQWRALEGFTRWVGGFVPRITAEGLLLPAAWKDNGRRFVIGAGTPLLELRWQDRRYGVYSEVLVVDKVRRQRQRVEHTAFLDRGGCCRRVLYVPGRSSSAAMRYTGQYQIERSREGARQLTAVLPGRQGAAPGSVIRMERSDIGIQGDFYVEEAAYCCNAAGETTTLRMRRLEE